MTTTHPVVQHVTARIAGRSTRTRQAYLRRVHASVQRGAARQRLGCANLAHAFAAAEPDVKRDLRRKAKPNVGIVTSYDDMLSAPPPFEDYPRRPRPITERARARSTGPRTPTRC